MYFVNSFTQCLQFLFLERINKVKIFVIKCSLRWNINNNFPLIKFDVSSIKNSILKTFETPCQSLFIFSIRCHFWRNSQIYLAIEKDSRWLNIKFCIFLRACQTHLRIKFSKSGIIRKSFCFLTSPAVLELKHQV